ncbi:MAG: nucleotide exchange factor GrpE [Patescibacteria group bacterium]
MEEDKNNLAEEYLNGWKRAKADLINYKKDEAKRFEDIVKFGNELLMHDLITTLDAFNLAVASLKKNGTNDEGIRMIKTQLEDALKRHGLEKLIVSVGQQFDPTLQEAIAEVEISPTSSPQINSGQIVEEVEAGYTLNGKLIRPARVKVAK